MSEEQEVKSDVDLYREGHAKVKELIMSMNGLSEEGFLNKHYNDPYFRKGFLVLVDLLIEAKFKGGKGHE